MKDFTLRISIGPLRLVIHKTAMVESKGSTDTDKKLTSFRMVISFVSLVPVCVFLSTDGGYVPREWLAGERQ